jgi:DNA-binding CsgD family transcriptional regulator
VQPAELYREIARAPSERAIASLVLNHGPDITGAPTIGYYALSPQGTDEIHVRGMSDKQLDMYENHGRKVDALLAWVSANHVPACMDISEVERFPAFRQFVKQQGIELLSRQYLLAPVVLGDVVGMIHCCTSRTGVLAPDAMQFAQAMSTHVSARVAVLRALGSIASQWDGALTRRELEVAQLAAQGQSTDSIGRALGVSANTIKKHMKSLYAKLRVSSRAELGAMLLLGPRSLGPAPRLPDLSALPSGRSMYLYDD